MQNGERSACLGLLIADMSKKKILIISFSHIKSDPRVMRQIIALKNDYSISVCGCGGCPHSDVTFYEVHNQTHSVLLSIKRLFLLLSGRYEDFYWTALGNIEAYRILKGQSFDLILANDSNSILFLNRLSELKKTKTVIDLHEYYLDVSSALLYRLFLRKYYHYVERKYLPFITASMTVCEGIANLYKEEIGIECSVVTNAPQYLDIIPSEIDECKIKLVHHGLANKDRKILELVHVANGLDERFSLDLVLVNGDTSYFKKVEKLVSKTKGKVRILPSFPMLEISERLNKYDLGVCMLNTNCLSKKYALPNKFFEWIQGRLGVVTWPLPEMKRLIERYQIGVVSKECTVPSMIETLNSLSLEQIKQYKNNSVRAAKELNSQRNKNKIRNVISDAFLSEILESNEQI